MKTSVFWDITRTTGRHGRAIAQAISRRLPTAAILIRAQVRSSGICGGQSGTGTGFIQVLRFPLPILIPHLLHIHHLTSGAATIDQLVADVPHGLSSPHPKKLKKKKMGVIPDDRTPHNKLCVQCQICMLFLHEVCKLSRNMCVTVDGV
jgi:hypothetical protein